MARYIDVDMLIERIIPPQKEDDSSCVLLGDVRKILYDFVNEAPTADVVEAKHGEWIECSNELNKYCSVCNKVFGTIYDEKPFCPNCGAIMDGGVKRNDL